MAYKYQNFYRKESKIGIGPTRFLSLDCWILYAFVRDVCRRPHTESPPFSDVAARPFYTGCSPFYTGSTSIAGRDPD